MSVPLRERWFEDFAVGQNAEFAGQAASGWMTCALLMLQTPVSLHGGGALTQRGWAILRCRP